MEKDWAELTPEERREERFKQWLSPDVKFSSPQAAETYRARVTRFIKAIKLEEPDRVPVILPAANFPAFYAGGNLKKVMYDYDELKRTWLKFLRDFDSDSFVGAALIFPARVFDMIDYKLFKWPGHGLADDSPSYQYIEGEYMKADEYDAFIRDPADYLLRYFLPRSAGAFAGFQKLGPMTPFVSIPAWYIAQFGDQDIRKTYQTLLDAGEESMKWMAVVDEVGQAALTAGIPLVWGGMSGAPFDMIGDTLRGTQGIMLDMYRQPEKLIEAMERLVPILLGEAVGMANASGCPIIAIPLHKGTGGFMSNKQYQTFYWPTFRELMMGLISEGLVPMPFAEGNYEPRLDIIKDVPRGTVIWWFEQMDMAKAKKVLGNTTCIAGNLPVTVLCTGTPQEVKEGCRKLIETCAPGGGYILTGGAYMDEGNPENLRAMMEAAKEYGVYK
jgi:uroporphyrinogen-III decarboxylase